jgi:hypothetical protein
MIAILGTERILNWRLRLFKKVYMFLFKYVKDDFKVLAAVIITLILISIKVFNIPVSMGIHITLNV